MATAVDDHDLADGHFAERGRLRGEGYAIAPVQAGGAGCLAGAVGAGCVVVEGDGGHFWLEGKGAWEDFDRTSAVQVIGCR